MSIKPYKPEVGTPIDVLDTPVLIVDLDRLECNFNVIAKAYRDSVVKMRQHIKNVKSPLVAHIQMETGGTLGGVCTAKVSEAEVMMEGGITDILIPNQVVTKDKIVRLVALAKQGDVKVCIDNARNLRDISEIAEDHNVEIGVLVEVDTMMGRAGIRNPRTGIELAKLATVLPGVIFRGVMCHQAIGSGPTDRQSRFERGETDIQKCLDVKASIEAAGINVDIVSAGETHTYDVVLGMPGVTETEGGTYAMLSTKFSFMEEFKIANKVLGTVISVPSPGVAVGDVGSYAMASPVFPNPTYGSMLPSLEGVPGVSIQSIYPDHVVMTSNERMPLTIGDQITLLPGHQDMLVNRWDVFVAVRNGVVEAVWDIPARGCFA